jgi:hypothetical protein
MDGRDLQPCRTRESCKLVQRVGRATQQDHLDFEATGMILGSYAAKDQDSPFGMRCLCAAAQNGGRLLRGPIIEHFPQQIEVCSRRQWIKETLPDARYPIRHAGLAQQCLGTGDRAGVIDQRPVEIVGAGIRVLQPKR